MFYDFFVIENEWVVCEILLNNIILIVMGFVFNMKLGKFVDLCVCQVIVLMYNFIWINEMLQYGLFVQCESFWQNSVFVVMGVLEGCELEIFELVVDLIDLFILMDEVMMLYILGSSQLDCGNLCWVLVLMEEVGWIFGENGMLVKDGQMFDFEILGYSLMFDCIILFYVDNFQCFGVNVFWNCVDFV